ncbi:MAG: hypothetical protein E5V17_06000, partial [Mesorhizobium sp.]
MRKPGHTAVAQEHVFANPVVKLADTRVAPLICYEQLLILRFCIPCGSNRDDRRHGQWLGPLVTGLVAIQKSECNCIDSLFRVALLNAFS